MSATLFEAEPSMRRAASISEDGLYRYALLRRWADDGPVATFVMLNPSTADAEIDDPTIRRCISFAKSWDCAALHVLNLYAYRATKPADLWKAADPVGPDNDRYLGDHARMAYVNRWPFVAAWGVNAKPTRISRVRTLIGVFDDAFQCLGTSKDGAPRHPLYLKGDTALTPWPPRTP